MSEEQEKRFAEEQLLIAARSGDDEAFAELYRQHYDSAFGYACTLTSPTRAHDLVSDAIIRIYRLMRAGKGPETAFRAYFYTTIRSVNVDSLRRTGREIPVDDAAGAGDESTPDSAALHAECDTILRAMKTLPQRWQDVLWATAVEGRTAQELSTEMELSPNSVSVLAMRAREGLRQAYLAQHVESLPAGRECEQYTGDLARYVRGSLVPSRRGVVETHLQDCDECRSAVSGLDHINTRLAAVLLPGLLISLSGAHRARGAATTQSGMRSALKLAKTRPLDVMRLAVAGAKPMAIAVGVASIAVVGSATVGVIYLAGGSARGHRPTVGLGPLTSTPTSISSPVPTDTPNPRPTASATPAVGSPSPKATAAETRPVAPLPGTPLPTRKSPTPTTPTPWSMPTPTGTPTIEFTNIGPCAMNGATISCVDTTGEQLVVTPNNGGACQISNQVGYCSGPSTITDPTSPDPSTGQPSVLHTQSGANDVCTIRNQILSCYNG